jgi:hypothetical protein
VLNRINLIASNFFDLSKSWREMTSVVQDILENITASTWPTLEQLGMVADFAELHD